MIREWLDQIEILDFFENPKTDDDADKKWGERTGSRIFYNLLQEGDIEEIKEKKGYYILSDFGKKILKESKEELKKERRKEFFRHPLFIGVICVVLGFLLGFLGKILIDYLVK